MPDGTRRTGPNYDEDFYAWTRYQAEVLRTLRTDDNRFDREHLAEEVEDLGKSERHTVESQIVRILEHFLKLAYSPADQPRYGWMRSTAEGRYVLHQKLTPTLRRYAARDLAKLYPQAHRQAQLALREYGEFAAADALPAACPYSLEQVLEDDWYPEPTAAPEEAQ